MKFARKLMSLYVEAALSAPAYSFQTFTLGQVLTASQMNQVEVNIRDHVHGRAGVSGATTTVASAAGPDIWTSTGNVIDYTGTTTATSFAAAPVAGLERLLVCADAAPFTASANMLIEGVVSGNTLTLQANALVRVVAITTTKFKLTYSFSGSFTATGTGFTANPTATWTYTCTNGNVAVQGAATISGTSNATTFTITGFPVAIRPINSARAFLPINVTDNGAVINVGFASLGTDGVLTLYTTSGGAGWTAALTKSIYTREYTYSLN